MIMARYSFIQMSELEKRGGERNCASFETAARGFEPGFYALRVLIMLLPMGAILKLPIDVTTLEGTSIAIPSA